MTIIKKITRRMGTLRMELNAEKARKVPKAGEVERAEKAERADEKSESDAAVTEILRSTISKAPVG